MIPLNRYTLAYHLYNVFILKHWMWVLLGLSFIGLAATGHLGWGWALFGAAVAWDIMHTNYTARKSNHLDFYIVYLLLVFRPGSHVNDQGRAGAPS